VRSYLDAISILLDFAPSTGEGKKIYNPLLSPLSVNPARHSLSLSSLIQGDFLWSPRPPRPNNMEINYMVGVLLVLCVFIQKILIFWFFKYTFRYILFFNIATNKDEALYIEINNTDARLKKIFFNPPQMFIYTQLHKAAQLQWSPFIFKFFLESGLFSPYNIIILLTKYCRKTNGNIFPLCILNYTFVNVCNV